MRVGVSEWGAEKSFKKKKKRCECGRHHSTRHRANPRIILLWLQIGGKICFPDLSVKEKTMMMMMMIIIIIG